MVVQSRKVRFPQINNAARILFSEQCEYRPCKRLTGLGFRRTLSV
jgi:hypothetical protein